MKYSSFYLGLLFFSSINYIFPQDSSQIQKYRQDEYGNKVERKKAVMDGNLVRAIFRNDGQIGTWPDRPSGEWPKNSGHEYLNGFTILISSEVTAPGNQQIIHPVITSYREQVDFDPITNQLWVLEPVPGYSNTNGEFPAINKVRSSWPSIWPIALPEIDETWNNQWHGYFGKNNFKPDYETFFVIDDSQDKEFSRPPYSYYPLLSDHNRGGLGLRIETRGFAWNESIVEDVIFFQYDIFNLSDFDYPKTFLGLFIDSGVGGLSDPADDLANFNKDENLVFAYDFDGIAPPNLWDTGYMGIALLETPSNPGNNIDDDNDGLVDERTDDGIDNDNDWMKYSDLNANGIWDFDEPLNDDIGMDGLGPVDSNYTNADKGEGDGIPTLGEPNFEHTDFDELDIIGLSSFSLEKIYNHGPESLWLNNDEVIWNKLNSQNFDTTIQSANIHFILGAGSFYFDKGENEKLSTAILFGTDYDDLIFNKKNAQQFYINYAFTEGASTDIPVKFDDFLHTDTLQGTFEIKWEVDNYTSQNIIASLYIAIDGEDYKYVSTDENMLGKFFLNTNNYDDGIFYKFRIICYDKHNSGIITSNEFFTINNNIEALPQLKFIFPFQENDVVRDSCNIIWKAGDADGDVISTSLFYHSNNSNTYFPIVENLSSKDTTFKWLISALPNNSNYFILGKVFSANDTVLVKSSRFTIENVRDLYPGQDFILEKRSDGTGTFYISLVNKSLVTGNNYSIKFSTMADSTTLGYQVYDQTNNIKVLSLSSVISENESPLFDGIRLKINNDEREMVVDSLTGWISGNSNLNFPISLRTNNPSRYKYSPSDYVLEFLSQDSYQTPFNKISVNLIVFNLSGNYQTNFELLDNDNSNSLTLGDIILIIEDLETNYTFSWQVGYYKNHSGTTIYPQGGDKFRITTTKPFVNGDEITFTTKDLVVGVKDKIFIDEFSLSQNFPNPFNPTTKLKYKLKDPGLTNLSIFDILGREVITLVKEYQTSGVYELIFEATNLSSGVYFYKLTQGEFSISKKMLILR